MVEASEIDGIEKLEQWLKGFPHNVGEARAREISVGMAFRAAARVFPIVVCGMSAENEDGAEHDFTPLSILRCLWTASFAVASPERMFDRAEVDAIAEAVKQATIPLVIQVQPTARLIIDATVAARAAVRSSALPDPTGVAAGVGDAIHAATYSDTEAKDASVDAMVADAAGLSGESGQSLEAAPLWLDANPLVDVWAEARKKLEAAPDDWSPVIAWYEHLLDPKGRALRVEVLRDIANGRDRVTGKVIDWEGGPPKALPVIGEIWGRYMGGGDPSFEDQVREMPKPSPSQVALTKQAVVEHRTELPPTIACVQEFILLEIERLQQSNQLNAEMPEMCRSIVGSLVTMHEALDRIDALVPEGDALSDADAEEIVSLGKLYKDKLLALPRDKADEVVAKVWETGGIVVDLGLVAGSSGLLLMMGFEAYASVALGAMAFGRKNAGQIIDAAKEYLKKSAN